MSDPDSERQRKHAEFETYKKEYYGPETRVDRHYGGGYGYATSPASPHGGTMLVREVMKTQIKTLTPDDPLIEAARQMRDGDFGVIPVVEQETVIGLLTDRDIVTRAAAEARDLTTTPVRAAMTSEVLSCFEDDSIESVTQIMSDRQVRRIPVVRRKDGKLVGIVSLADLARTQEASTDAAAAFSEISEPKHKEPGSDGHSARH